MRGSHASKVGGVALGARRRYPIGHIIFLSDCNINEVLISGTRLGQAVYAAGGTGMTLSRVRLKTSGGCQVNCARAGRCCARACAPLRCCGRLCAKLCACGTRACARLGACCRQCVQCDCEKPEWCYNMTCARLAVRQHTVRRLRCVWRFRGRSPGTSWRCPSKLSKAGLENSKRIVTGAGGGADSHGCHR